MTVVRDRDIDYQEICKLQLVHNVSVSNIFIQLTTDYFYYQLEGQIMKHLKERVVIEQHLDEMLNPDITLQKNSIWYPGQIAVDDTRIKILAMMFSWLYLLLDDRRFWVCLSHRSISRCCKDGRILWAQCFISWDDEMTTKSQNLIARLVIYSSCSTVSKAIYDILQARPNFKTRSPWIGKFTWKELSKQNTSHKVPSLPHKISPEGSHCITQAALLYGASAIDGHVSSGTCPQPLIGTRWTDN